jgi:hypothetical protein
LFLFSPECCFRSCPPLWASTFCKPRNHSNNNATGDLVAVMMASMI